MRAAFTRFAEQRAHGKGWLVEGGWCCGCFVRDVLLVPEAGGALLPPEGLPEAVEAWATQPQVWLRICYVV